ncbi:nuclear transport factor 2 family protein [Hydrocarboniphaga sp.]|uniref:nuclear transport factor 2 family protein n=1 Tax=Hydrocarboniphaga sp. TaxID=2033016 RepID=UPI003D0EDAF4
MSVATPTLAELAAKQAITEVLHRYCRSMDRMDRELALSCWHAGGTDEHTPLFSGTGEAFVDWVWKIHEPMLLTRHTLSNVLIEVDGDNAWSESYWTVLLRIARDGAIYDLWSGGRYVDHLSCVAGRWAFVHRRSVHDWDQVQLLEMTMANFPGPALVEPAALQAPLYPARRSQQDPSYQALVGHAMQFGKGGVGA